MGTVHQDIDDRLRVFIEAQHLFFVATAPLAADGHINVSPKGLDTLRVLDGKTVAYLDHPGSGAETIAHLRENGRVVVRMCAFQGPPQIVRLHGRGRVLEPQDAEFDALRALFAPDLTARAIVRVDVERVSDSCGYGVPLLAFEKERRQLPAWSARKGDDELAEYQREKNSASIDGLPALRWTAGRP